MEGHGNAKCDFTANMAADGLSYTVKDIKTDEAGSWTIVFDKAQTPPSPAPYLYISISTFGESKYWMCNNDQVEGETECYSSLSSYPAGTYTINVSSDPLSPWGESVPLIKAFKVGDKDYCGGEICKIVIHDLGKSLKKPGYLTVRLTVSRQ